MRRFRASLSKDFTGDESGIALLEFGLAATFLLSVIFAIMDGSRALYADHFVSNAAREATRYAMVRGSSWSGTSCATASTYSCMATPANVTTYVQSITPMGFTANNLLVTTTWPGTTVSGASCTATGTTNAPGCVVKVTVSYNFNFVLPLLPRNTLVLASTSSVAIAQ